MDAQEERLQVEAVAKRLSSRFGELPPEVVVDSVRAAQAGLRGAVIRDFVPLLVEKEVRDRLSALLRQQRAQRQAEQQAEQQAQQAALVRS